MRPNRGVSRRQILFVLAIAAALFLVPSLALGINPPAEDATGTPVWIYGQSEPVSIVATSPVDVTGTVTLSPASISALASALAGSGESTSGTVTIGAIGSWDTSALDAWGISSGLLVGGAMIWLLVDLRRRR